MKEDTLSRRIEFLKTVPLFAGLSDADLTTLAGDFRPKNYRPGDYIFHQGDYGRELYVVTQGKVRVFRVSQAGGETSIQVFGPRDVVGEFATIDGQPRSATAKAIGPSAMLEIRGELFLQRMREMPDLALGMTRLLASKVRWAAAYAETIAQYDAAGRLLHILLLYNEQFGQPVEPGRRYRLDLGLDQTDLASLVGARREWVNRILRDWRARGLIEYEAGMLTILDLPRVVAERDQRAEGGQPESIG
jgi:CRP/FNR family cyclic AMP-dependent transcriptional regulator